MARILCIFLIILQMAVPKSNIAPEYLNHYAVEQSSIRYDKHKVTFTLLRDKSPLYSDDEIQPTEDNIELLNLNAEIEAEHDHRIRIRIGDVDRKRWEVPFSTQDFSDEDQDFLLSFQKFNIKVSGFNFTQERFGFSLIDRDAPSHTILDSKNTYFRFLEKYIVIELLLDSTRLMGLGERVANISLREGTYTLFNRDQGTPMETRKNPGNNLYGMHPFMMYQTHSGLFAGLFMKNSNAMQVGVTDIKGKSLVRFSMTGGIIDLYVFYKGGAQYILQQYHEIIGKPSLPPLWALGYHHGKSGIKNMEELKTMIHNFTSQGVPIDSLWVDIELLDNGKNFIVDSTKFPDLKKFVEEELHSNNIHFMPVLEPGLKADPHYTYYEMAVNSKGLVRNDSENVHFGKSRLGKIGYPNFFNKNMCKIWRSGIKEYLESTGADGFWLNNNEFSNLCDGECHDNAEGNRPYENIPFVPGKTPLHTHTLSMTANYSMKTPESDPNYYEFNIHSINGLMMANATYQSLEDGSKRKFLASRSTFPGIQKFAAGHWLGENDASWQKLKYSLPGITNFHLYGIPIVGASIGGIVKDTDEELYSRWMQIGLLYPLSLSFASQESRRHDPFAFSEKTLEIARAAIRVKYSLMMYLYSTIFEQSLVGGAAIQPLFFEFPNDHLAYKTADRVLLYGKGLMITAPFEAQHATYPVYFPNSNWYKLPDGQNIVKFTPNKNSGLVHQVSVRSDYPNIFLRGGSIIPYQNALLQQTRNILELKNIPSVLIVALDENDQASGRFVVDDGESLDTITNKKYRHYSFTFSNKTLKVLMLEGHEYNEKTTTSEEFERIEIWGATRFKNISSACAVSNVMSRRGLKFDYDSSRNVLTVYDKSKRKLAWNSVEAIGVFANDDYNWCMGGFVATKIKITDQLRRMSALLETGFDLSERKYEMEAILLNDNILNLRISPTDWKAWQVPGIIDAKFRNTTAGKLAFAEYLFAISTDPDPFFFAVTNPGDPEDTTITTQNMPIVLNHHHIEVPTLIKTNAIYGLGERVFPTFALKEGKYTLFTHDSISPLEDGKAPGKNIYGYHPFYMFRMPDNQFGGVFLLTSNAMDVSITPFDESMYQVNHIISGGMIDMFIISRGSPNMIIQQYHNIIGKPHVLPFWAFGNHQCRYGYHTQARLKEVVEKYQKAKLPLDGMWTDIDYMESLKPFTVDKSRYPSLHNFVGWLHSFNIKFIPIVEAAIAINEPNLAYKLGLEKNIFIKSGNPNSKYPHVIGIVWPGYATFVDFIHPNSTDYWIELLEYFHKELIPFDGIWLDMDEVTTFCDGECDLNGNHRKVLEPGNPLFSDMPYIPGHRNMEMKSLPLHAQHYSPSPDDAPNYIQYNLHTMWAHLQIKATNAYFQKHKQRPFIIARSTFPGTGRYGSHWLGDNKSKWPFLGYSIVGIYNFHMFGIPFTGADLCGFNGNTTTELCRRWYQVGAFYPFCRNHNDINTVDQEPYADKDLQKTAGIALQLRYSLIRYMYTLHMLTTRNGGTYFKPVFFDFYQDPKTHLNPEKTFMFGYALKVTPILEQGASSTETYFPNCNWYDLHTGEKVVKYEESRKEGVTLKLSASLESEHINVHVKGGSILSIQDTLSHPVLTTVDLHNMPINFIIAPDHEDKASGFVYYDVETDPLAETSILYNLTYIKSRLSFSHVQGAQQYLSSDNRDESLSKLTLFNAKIYENVGYACATLHSGDKIRLTTKYHPKTDTMEMSPKSSIHLKEIFSIIWNDENITC